MSAPVVSHPGAEHTQVASLRTSASGFFSRSRAMPWTSGCPAACFPGRTLNGSTELASSTALNFLQLQETLPIRQSSLGPRSPSRRVMCAPAECPQMQISFERSCFAEGLEYSICSGVAVVKSESELIVFPVCCLLPIIF